MVKIINAYNVSDLYEVFKDVPQDTFIFIDIDDTIITPVSHAFRTKSPYKTMIDELKASPHLFPNHERILSAWRLQRKVMLTDTSWPALLESLRRKYKTFALTKMESGHVGNISSMEEWRYTELQELNIFFTPELKDSAKIQEKLFHKNRSGIFWKGIFITGSLKKSDVLEAIFSYHIPEKVIFIDDREDQIEDVANACTRHAISFVGILYKGVSQIPGQTNHRLADFQKKYLLEKEIWLEDEEAQKKFRKK